MFHSMLSTFLRNRNNVYNDVPFDFPPFFFIQSNAIVDLVYLLVASMFFGTTCEINYWLSRMLVDEHAKFMVIMR